MKNDSEITYCVARREDFQKAITDSSRLGFVAVYSDGTANINIYPLS